MSENTQPKREATLLEFLNMHGLHSEHKAFMELQKLGNIVQTLAKVARGGGGEMGVTTSQQLLAADEIIHGVKPRHIVPPEVKLEELADKMKREQSRDTGAARVIREPVPQYEADWPMGLNQGPPTVIGDQIIFKSTKHRSPFALSVYDIKFVSPDITGHKGKEQGQYTLIQTKSGLSYVVSHPFMVVVKSITDVV